MSLKVAGKVKTFSFTFNWEIDDFSTRCTDPGDCLESPKFSANSVASNAIQWCLQLYPNGQKEDYRDYLSIFLRADKRIRAVASLKLFDREGRIVLDRTLNECLFGNDGWGYKKFISREFVLNDLLNEDKLTIGCEIMYTDNEFQNSNAPSEEDDVLHLGSSANIDKFYETLLTESKFSDVSLVSEGRVIKAHKCILASCSKVFAGMFEGDTKGSIRIEITDTRYDVLVEMIRFVYTGRIDEVEKIVEELAITAEKYALRELRRTCEDTMTRHLCPDNVVDRLRLACELRMDGLRRKAIEFIVENASEVCEKPEFDTLPREIVCEVFRCLVKKK